MTLEQFKAIWVKAQAAINANEKYFSELDAATGGDGDHGTAIVAALNAIVNADGDDFKSYIENMAEKLETEASGSTSSLYGGWCEGMAEAVPAGKTELTADEVAAMFEGGFDEICALTKARKGDKTMMDALQPATEALLAAQGEGEAAMFAAAAKAAKEGSEATAQMQAKFGRARNLGERSIGAIDAGSASMAVIFSCFA
ncbi:MAG: DAK2 domain-containing protein [bacterium]|nr:DAK2 domain-containing protein [bacterium]